MAKSTEITAIDQGIVSKSNYRGNVQAIPVSIKGADQTTNANGTYDISATLPQEASVISCNLFVDDLGTAFTVDVGYNGTAAAIGAQASGDAAGNIVFPKAGLTSGSVDVGGKILQVVVAGSDNTGDIVGHILITTNE